MTCSQCGSDVAAGSAACPNCGAQQPGNVSQGAESYSTAGAGTGASAGTGTGASTGTGAGAGTGAGTGTGTGTGAGASAGTGASQAGAPRAATSTPAFNFDAKRWTRDDRIVGGATLVFFIALFLPWFTAPGFTVNGQTFGGGSVNGLYHGYMYIDLILALAVLGYLVVRAGFEQLPFDLPLKHEQLLLGATGLTFVLTLISFLTKPTGAGWGIGAFIGLIAAIVAVVPLGLPFAQARSGR